MKKLILRAGLALVLLAGPRWGFCADPIFIEPFPNSNYNVTQGTVTISSTSVTTFAASSRFREFYIGDPLSTSNLFYRADGFNTFVSTVGWWVPSGTGQKIESSNQLNFLLAPGGAAYTFRYVIFEK